MSTDARGVPARRKECVGLQEGVFLIDTRGRLLKANTEFFRLLGYAREDLASLSFFDLASAGSPLLDAGARAFHESFSFNYFRLAQEHPLPLALARRDGRLSTFEMNSVIFPGADGTPLFAAGFLSPLIQEPAAEPALQQQPGACFWDIEHGRYGIILTDFSSRIVKVNERMVRMLGYGSEQELLGRYILELGPLSGTHLCTTGVKITIDQAHYQSQIDCSARLFQNGRSTGTVYMFKKDGTVAPMDVALSLLTGGDGGCWGTMAVCCDITRRARTEEEALQSRNFFESVFAAASDGVYVTDEAGSFIMVNDALCKMTGFSRRELLEKLSPEKLGDQPPAHLTEQELEQRCRTGSFSCTEAVWQRKSGEFFNVEVRLAALRQDCAEEGGIVGVVRDVTERARIAEDLSRAQQELEQLVRERTESLSAMNTTLELVIKKADEEREALEKTLRSNFEQFIFPYIERMKALRIDERQRASLSVIEANLNDILNSLAPKAEPYSCALTQAEIQIANLIKQGLATKEIAELTGLSSRTIDHRRESIRKKLGITDRTTSLSSFLLSSF